MKRFIVFAYDSDERAAGWQNIFGLTSELQEAEMLVSVAKDSANVDLVELYDIHTEKLVTQWLKGVDRLWREFEPE